MRSFSSTVQAGSEAITVSPLQLSHQLLLLAEDAHRSGLSQSATQLLHLAHSVCSTRPKRQ